MPNNSAKLLERLLFCKINSWNIIRSVSINKQHFKEKKYDLQKEYSAPNNKPSKVKQPGYFYFKDSLSADIVAHHICDNWKNGYVFEINPGPGILSKALLKAGVPKLRVFEKNEAFLPKLKEISEQHSNFEIVEGDFLFLPSIEAKSFDENSACNLEAFFKDVPKLSWGEGAPFRIFSIISSTKSIRFLRFLLAALSNRASVFSYGRCEFFFILSHLEYSYLIAEPKENFCMYRWSTVLYQLLFEATTLNKFTPKEFSPCPRNGKKNKGTDFYLVKLVPKSDLYSSLVNENKLQDFYFFVRHHLFKRSGLVIPTMENLVPSCGPRLIYEGMNVFTKFGDLNPEQILTLFNQFSSWPEYNDSIYHVSLKKFYGKSGIPYDFDDNA